MIGNISGINGVVDNSTARVFAEGTRVTETPEEARARRFTGGEVDSPSRNLARYIDRMADLYVPNLDVMMVYRLDRFGRGGHHRPFNDLGRSEEHTSELQSLMRSSYAVFCLKKKNTHN